METIFVAMSGGMDSTYAAYLLKESGYNVVGVTFRLIRPSPSGLSCGGPRDCADDAVGRARAAAKRLSIPHSILDLHQEFEDQVIAPFIAAYKQGRTPNPCILCNGRIKFSAFAQWAFALGADKIATGHYAAVDETKTGHAIKKGKDREKDQSYFLYTIPRNILGRVLFPLAASTKDETRQIMSRLGLQDSTVQESQDICFVPGNDYRAFLAPFIGAREGAIYLHDGRWVGRHQGLHLYTIGQRRGIHVPYRYPLYVLELRIDDNALVVGPRELLLKKQVIAAQTNFFGTSALAAAGKTRYRQEDKPCTFSFDSDRLHVNFTDPVSAISPGQSVVLYDEDRVLGGGIIEEAR